MAKTHHYGIVLQIVSALVVALQGDTGQTVNLADPAVWTTLLGVFWTVVGLLRNKPQGSIKTTAGSSTVTTTS